MDFRIGKCGIGSSGAVDRIRRARDDDDWHKVRHRRPDAFTGGADLGDVVAAAARAYAWEKVVAAGGLPGVRAMENAILDFGAVLVHQPAGGAARVTASGTESVILALWAALQREERRGRSRHGRTVVTTRAAHPAIDKAAALFDVEVIRTPLLADGRGDAAAVRSAIDGRTVMVLASVPAYPYGLIDPVDEIARAVDDADVWLHVDHCIGAYLVPFVEARLSYCPPFDFRLGAVRSLSADPHKFAYAPKGISTVLFRDRADAEGAGFSFADWPRDPMRTTTLDGTRSAFAVVSAWAVLAALGEEGLTARAVQVVENARQLRHGIAAIDGLSVVGAPELSVVAIRRDGDRDGALHRALAAAGYNLDPLHDPEGVQVNIGPFDGPFVSALLADIATFAETV